MPAPIAAAAPPSQWTPPDAHFPAVVQQQQQQQQQQQHPGYPPVSNFNAIPSAYYDNSEEDELLDAIVSWQDKKD